MPLKYLWIAALFYCCCIAVIAPARADNSKEAWVSGTWGGIEILGTDVKTAQSIRKLIPIQKGAHFSITREQKDLWCLPVINRMPEHEVECSLLTYSNGERYYLIYLIPKKVPSRSFRPLPPAPTGINTTIPKVLLQTLNDFYDRFYTLIKEGVSCQEFKDNGYFDYSDPVLHDLVQELIKTVPSFNKELFNVLSYSKNDDERADAAYLLSWANNLDNLKKVIELDLLNDPYEGVRNNTARSMLAFIDRVEDKKVIAQSVDAFCKQAQLISFTDKNKALSALEIIFETHPQARLLPNAACIKTINDDAEHSILNNLGGVAKRIQKLLKEPTHA